MYAVVLLAFVTACYASYNLLIKISGAHVPETATTTVLATVCLQVAALVTSLFFLSWLHLGGGHVFALNRETLVWAALGGVAIGLAEIGYFYLFSGIGGDAPMPANIAIPTIVAGTVVIALIVSYLILDEAIGWRHMVGAGLIVAGIVIMFKGGARPA